MRTRDCARGSATCWRVATLCLAFLITLAPSAPAFATAFLMAPLETPAHPASRLASPAGEAAVVGTTGHQHGDESVASDGGASGCPATQSIDSCMAVCCVAILSQSLEHTRAPLPCETEFFLTIPSSASRIASHPPPEAIA